MRKWLLTAFACLLTLSLRAQSYEELGAKLEEYFTVLAGESAAVQNAECDFLISACQDSLVRQYVALKVYDHYLQSKIMGDEAVAVHVAEKWFLSGEIPMHSDGDLLNAQVFVMFNKNSLIGMQAPVITLKDSTGRAVQIPAAEGYSVLYFYDTSCSTCKVETPRLRRFMEESDYPLTVYAINVGDLADAWEQYRGNLPGAVHLWDPEHESDWQLQYGVLQTPKMFLLAPGGEILGRGLDVPALKMLLSKELSTDRYVYGEPAQMERYKQLFAAYGDTLTTAHIQDVADYLAARTFGEGNVSAFKQTMGDLLYYLSSQRSEAYREAIGPIVEKYIRLGEVWNTPEDKAQILSLADLLLDFSNRSPVGSLVPDVQVPGVLRRKGCLFVRASRPGTYSLRKLKGNPAYVVFYSPDCSTCKETLAAVDALVKGNRKVRVLLVDMDSLYENDMDKAVELLDSFDLSALPFVLELAPDGTVLRRYVQL
jgi:thiol-disulfide isomerase/thioredoxin